MVPLPSVVVVVVVVSDTCAHANAACSSNQVTRIAKILDARSRSKPQRGRKLFTFRVGIFLTS
jgi:hypothetical protein